MDNRLYAENLCSGKPNPETIARVVSTLDKYGDDKWWLSDDKRIIGYFQLNEPIIVVPFDKFHEGLEALLCRPVWTHELGLNYEGLKNEAANAILGIERTDEERQDAINAGIFTLLEHAQKHGKDLLLFDPTARAEEEEHG